MKSNQIEALVAIANAGSISGAAAILNKSQPAVSSLLKGAEQLLGAHIFVREPSGMTPTPVGLEIIARARVISNEYKRLHEQVQQIQGEMIGSVKIMVSPIAAAKIVPLAISSFKKKYPTVKIQIESGHSPSAFTPLRQGEVDLVVAPSPVRASEAVNLAYEALFSVPLCFVAGAGTRFSTTSNILDLADAHWLMFGPKEREYIIQEYLSSLGFKPNTPITCSDSVLSVMNMLENSDCVCTCPLSLFEDLSGRWNIVQIPVHVDFGPLEVSVISSSIRPLTVAALALKDAIVKEAAKLSI
ncbi:LysR family transcriptional regulator [Phaeobacter sp. J2-8]|uniref:LysR family transcriptional regulator n=1 Tax=Phaeobacter sp. J2-8 TaxID=2931394 RepID=UPI001FCF9CA0|nr:LysR family transcriptional regulator [Phaeobacter sp. J2-8]MCJ7871285.1 LysR family transcriptional regulator [Phaeobacter sp. J2-8]